MQSDMAPEIAAESLGIFLEDKHIPELPQMICKPTLHGKHRVGKITRRRNKEGKNPMKFKQAEAITSVEAFSFVTRFMNQVSGTSTLTGKV